MALPESIPPPSRRRSASLSLEPPHAKRRCSDYTAILAHSDPPSPKAPSCEDAGSMRDERDSAKGWDLAKGACASLPSVFPESFQASFVKACAPSPVDSFNAASAHGENCQVVAHDEPVSPAHLAPPTASPHQSQQGSEQAPTSRPWSGSTSSSDASTAYVDKPAVPDSKRVIPPPWSDRQRSNYLENPATPNPAFLQPNIFQTSAILPPQQQLSWNQSRIPQTLLELQDNLENTRKCRMKVKALRARLRAIQDKKLDAENAFLLAARRVTVEPLNGETLSTLSETLNTTRNEASTLQMEYDTLERELEQSESKLEQSALDLSQELGTSQMPETQLPGRGSSGSDSSQQTDFQKEAYPGKTLLKMPESTRAGFSADGGNTAFAAPADEAFRGLAGNETTDTPPLFRKLINTVTKLKMAEEEHSEIVEERQEIISKLYNRYLIAVSVDTTQQIDEAKMKKVHAILDSLFSVGITEEFRDMFGPFLVTSDMQYLEDFDRTEKAILAAIRDHTEQVARLRSECLRTGALPNHLAARERVVILGEEGDGAHEISIDPTPELSIPVGESRLPNPLTHAYFPVIRQNCWYLLTRSPMTAKSALTHMLQLPPDFPNRAARIEDLVKEYGIETMLTRFAPENKADFVNRWLLQQLRMSSVNELQLFSISSRHLRIVDVTDVAVWQRSAIAFWARDGTNAPRKLIHGSEVSSSLSTAMKDGR